MSREQSSDQEPWQVLDELYQRALTRFLQGADFDYRNHLDPDELAEYAAAEEAEQQQIGKPRPATVQYGGKVVIEVLGGVAEVTSKPDGVEVEIIDHDNGETSALDGFLERTDMPQDDDNLNETE